MQKTIFEVIDIEEAGTRFHSEAEQRRDAPPEEAGGKERAVPRGVRSQAHHGA